MTTDDAINQRDLGPWWWQGLRTAALLRVDWAGLRVTPGNIVWLTIAPTLVGVGVARLYYVGSVEFFPPALLFGWMGTLVTAWVSWLLVPVRSERSRQCPPTAVHLFALLVSQMLIVSMVTAFIGLFIARGIEISPRELHHKVFQVAAWLGLAWSAVAQLMLLRRIDDTARSLRWVASAFLTFAVIANATLDAPAYWYLAAEPASGVPKAEPFKLTQELTELQPVLLREQLGAIQAGRIGEVNLFAITFAPYAAEDVFRRESELVAQVMQERFGAANRTIQLVNSAGTASARPWATPLNLKRAIQRMADVMDRERDVLFIHLTSHGARNGQLAADFGALTVDFVTPTMLNFLLDEAGIRFRVISVSACYSGSWIEPLFGPGTLVMTAADADHTSYGCGRGSEFTFFGRAMYAEELRHTRSFEDAHSAARLVIDQRERAAGKPDGYSNPQIRIGEKIRLQLAKLAAQQDQQR